MEREIVLTDEQIQKATAILAANEMCEAKLHIAKLEKELVTAQLQGFAENVARHAGVKEDKFDFAFNTKDLTKIMLKTCEQEDAPTPIR